MQLEEETREVLIRRHMPDAARIADRYRGRGVPTEDLRQEAYIGLMFASDRFDPARYPKIPFMAYASIHCLRYVLGAIAEAGGRGIAGVPHRLARAANRCRRAREKLMAGGIATPSVADVACATGLPVSIVLQAEAIPCHEGQGRSDGILAQLPDRRYDEVADELWDALSLCTRIEIAIVTRLFGLDGRPRLNASEAAVELGIPAADVLAIAESARLTFGDELRRRGWTWDRLERALARSA
jgi:hypothetical protein